MTLISTIQNWIAKGRVKTEPHIVNAKRLAFYVGLIAFLLAPAMLVNVYAFSACFRDSISHFYYSRFTGDVLVGALVFIAAFLFAYQGRFVLENCLAKAAGLGALGVAWFPVSGTGCEGRAEVSGRAFVSVATDGADPFKVAGLVAPDIDQGSFDTMFQFLSVVDTVHFASASVLLGTLMVFCVFVFTIPDQTEIQADGTYLPGKRARNTLYYTCGFFMFAALLAIMANALGLIDADIWLAWNLMFWMEWVILFFFGICWMAKGRFDYVKDSWTGKIFARWFMDDVHPDMAEHVSPS